MADLPRIPGSDNIPARVPAVASIVPVSERHLAALIAVHRAAFKGYMNERLGDVYLRAFFRWFCRHSQGIALVAIADDAVVGYAAGAPLELDAELNRALALPAVWGLATHPWLFCNRRVLNTLGRRIRLIFRPSLTEDPIGPELAKPVMSLYGIAVAPTARGKQIGLRLLEEFERRARALGMAALQLTVYAQNTTARQLYERCGWTPGKLPADPTLAMNFSKPLT